MNQNDAEYGIGLIEEKKVVYFAYDIECTGMLGYSYSMWDANIHKVVEYPILLSFSYAEYEVGKEYGENGPKVKCRTIADTDTYSVDPKNDKLLVMELWELMRKAETTLGHNSKAFDDKMSRMFFMKHGLKAIAPTQQLDTKVMAKQAGKFVSNSLNNLSDFFGIGQKTTTTHADLWWDIINGGKEGKKAAKKMATYNNQDVKLTIKLFEILRPWAKNNVNAARLANKEFACPHCLSDDYHAEGTRSSKTGRYQRYQCNNEKCFGWFSERTAIKKKDGDIQPAFA